MTLEDIYFYCIKNKVLVNKAEFLKWYSIVEEILNNEEFLKRCYFKHHEKQSVYEHSILVSAYSYELAKKYNCDIDNCTIAGMLHDFYTEAWQYSSDLEKLGEKYRLNFLPNQPKKSLLKKHGFVHPQCAAENALEYFPLLINHRIENAILTHMFPLSLVTKNKIPKYKEAWIVQLADKIASCKDFPKLKEIPKYIGIGKKHKNNK